MNKLFLFAVLLSSLLTAKDITIKNKYYHSISTMYVTDPVNMRASSIAIVNGKNLTCFCGGDPLLIMIAYGHVQAFCWQHIPEIDINMGSDCRCKGL